MAESKVVVPPMELSAMERAWIQQSLQLQRASLIRSRGKEIAGGDIWTLRGKEVEALTSLLNRF